MEEVTSHQEKAVCCFCRRNDNNEILYGKVYKMQGIVTHYFCLLLSSNIVQNGDDHEGILGFMPKDIREEVKRGSRLRCSFCRCPGATIGCISKRCKQVFHLPCGIQRGSMHQFFEEFKSFCPKHRPRQKIAADVLVAMKDKDSTCAICLDSVTATPSFDTLWAPCCSKNAWFHRNCIQKLALSAGYFFKCPLCNNKKEFVLAMHTYGIYIPEQDAAWETEPNAFEGLLQRHDTCDADPCICPKGRKYFLENSRWEIILCDTCGSQGIHAGCGNLRRKAQPWFCSLCNAILNQVQKKKEDENLDTHHPRRQIRGPHISNSDNTSRPNFPRHRRLASSLPPRAPRRLTRRSFAEPVSSTPRELSPPSLQDLEPAVPIEEPAPAPEAATQDWQAGAAPDDDPLPAPQQAPCQIVTNTQAKQSASPPSQRLSEGEKDIQKILTGNRIGTVVQPEDPDANEIILVEDSDSDVEIMNPKPRSIKLPNGENIPVIHVPRQPSMVERYQPSTSRETINSARYAKRKRADDVDPDVQIIEDGDGTDWSVQWKFIPSAQGNSSVPPKHKFAKDKCQTSVMSSPKIDNNPAGPIPAPNVPQTTPNTVVSSESQPVPGTSKLLPTGRRRPVSQTKHNVGPPLRSDQPAHQELFIEKTPVATPQGYAPQPRMPSLQQSSLQLPSFRKAIPQQSNSNVQQEVITIEESSSDSQQEGKQKLTDKQSLAANRSDIITCAAHLQLGDFIYPSTAHSGLQRHANSDKPANWRSGLHSNRLISEGEEQCIGSAFKDKKVLAKSSQATPENATERTETASLQRKRGNSSADTARSAKLQKSSVDVEDSSVQFTSMSPRDVWVLQGATRSQQVQPDVEHTGDPSCCLLAHDSLTAEGITSIPLSTKSDCTSFTVQIKKEPSSNISFSDSQEHALCSEHQCVCSKVSCQKLNKTDEFPQSYLVSSDFSQNPSKWSAKSESFHPSASQDTAAEIFSPSICVQNISNQEESIVNMSETKEPNVQFEVNKFNHKEDSLNSSEVIEQKTMSSSFLSFPPHSSRQTSDMLIPGTKGSLTDLSMPPTLLQTLSNSSSCNGHSSQPTKEEKDSVHKESACFSERSKLEANTDLKLDPNFQQLKAIDQTTNKRRRWPKRRTRSNGKGTTLKKNEQPPAMYSEKHSNITNTILALEHDSEQMLVPEHELKDNAKLLLASTTCARTRTLNESQHLFTSPSCLKSEMFLPSWQQDYQNKYSSSGNNIKKENSNETKNGEESKSVLTRESILEQVKDTEQSKPAITDTNFIHKSRTRACNKSEDTQTFSLLGSQTRSVCTRSMTLKEVNKINDLPPKPAKRKTRHTFESTCSRIRRLAKLKKTTSPKQTGPSKISQVNTEEKEKTERAKQDCLPAISTSRYNRTNSRAKGRTVESNDAASSVSVRSRSRSQGKIIQSHRQKRRSLSPVVFNNHGYVIMTRSKTQCEQAHHTRSATNRVHKRTSRCGNSCFCEQEPPKPVPQNRASRQSRRRAQSETNNDNDIREKKVVSLSSMNVHMSHIQTRSKTQCDYNSKYKKTPNSCVISHKKREGKQCSRSCSLSHSLSKRHNSRDKKSKRSLLPDVTQTVLQEEHQVQCVSALPPISAREAEKENGSEKVKLDHSADFCDQTDFLKKDGNWTQCDILSSSVKNSGMSRKATFHISHLDQFKDNQNNSIRQRSVSVESLESEDSVFSVIDLSFSESSQTSPPPDWDELDEIAEDISGAFLINNKEVHWKVFKQLPLERQSSFYSESSSEDEQCTSKHVYDGEDSCIKLKAYFGRLNSSDHTSLCADENFSPSNKQLECQTVNETEYMFKQMRIPEDSCAVSQSPPVDSSTQTLPTSKVAHQGTETSLEKESEQHDFNDRKSVSRNLSNLCVGTHITSTQMADRVSSNKTNKPLLSQIICDVNSSPRGGCGTKHSNFKPISSQVYDTEPSKNKAMSDNTESTPRNMCATEDSSKNPKSMLTQLLDSDMTTSPTLSERDNCPSEVNDTEGSDIVSNWECSINPEAVELPISCPEGIPIGDCKADEWETDSSEDADVSDEAKDRKDIAGKEDLLEMQEVAELEVQSRVEAIALTARKFCSPSNNQLQQGEMVQKLQIMQDKKQPHDTVGTLSSGSSDEQEADTVAGCSQASLPEYIVGKKCKRKRKRKKQKRRRKKKKQVRRNHPLDSLANTRTAQKEHFVSLED